MGLARVPSFIFLNFMVKIIVHIKHMMEARKILVHLDHMYNWITTMKRDSLEV